MTPGLIADKFTLESGFHSLLPSHGAKKGATAAGCEFGLNAEGDESAFNDEILDHHQGEGVIAKDVDPVASDCDHKHQKSQPQIQQQPKNDDKLRGDDDDDDDDGNGAGAATAGGLSKGAKKRARAKAKAAAALEAQLRDQFGADGVTGVGAATEEQLAVARAELQKKRSSEKEARLAKDPHADPVLDLDLLPQPPQPNGGDGADTAPPAPAKRTWPTIANTTGAEPTGLVRVHFKNRHFPVGELSAHPQDFNTYRVASEEKRALDKLDAERIGKLRHAAQVHREVRTWAQTWIAPGMPLMTVTDRIEAKLAELIGKNGLHAGQAFPTGCSPNHIAAHYTPNTGDTLALHADDVLKIDIGTHIDGHIIDSAWTWYNNPRYDPLVDAVRAATNEGLKQAGIDVRLGDVGAAIQEVMESYEVELNKKVYRVRSIKNLQGHTIAPYVIHAGKSVPSYDNKDQTKMEEGDLFAIETFGSTGRGAALDDGECSHFMLNPLFVAGPPPASVSRNADACALLDHIRKTRSSLAFCRKWIDRDGFTRHLPALKRLCDAELVDRCPPLCDVKGSFTAQFEHTILLRPTCKEILSRGDDY